ncbi:hypothetical protein G8A07_02895 [Roseateles sp. DAIF2]|uniref:hypothetical protein n=1 Tax=Roseateles sp. DAIF2 TaxID=2714952 RepID=UPI0018A263F8|nr:hypothetical protein [Roseateles sp. DAIF2]QPF71978.1 hypothetical protein G8A07_02895 [Roseateles sp. DAIF2]
MNRIALTQAFALAIAFAAAPLAQAAPQHEVKQLPRVVITGKAQATAQQVVQQLPRVVVEGRSVQGGGSLLALNGGAAATKPAAQRG